jgi:hypothetical protein
MDRTAVGPACYDQAVDEPEPMPAGALRENCGPT